MFADGSVLFKEPFAALPEWLAHYSEAEETVTEEIIKTSPYQYVLFLLLLTSIQAESS